MVGAGLHVAEAVAGGASLGGVETGAVVGDDELEAGGGEGKLYRDFGRGAVADGVADGFAGDLKKFDRLGRREEAEGGFVDLEVEIDFARGGEFLGDGAKGGGEIGGGEIFGRKSGDVGADVADAAVEVFAGAGDTRFGFGGIGGDERAGGFESEAGGVEGLDDAVVEIATEADFFLKGTVEELLREEGVGFGALADVAFVGEFAGLGDGGFGEFGEGADLGAGGVERRAGVGGAGPANAEADEERGGENERGEGKWEGEAVREIGEAGGRGRHSLGFAMNANRRTCGKEERGERDEDQKENEAEDAREGVHAARVRMVRVRGGSKGDCGRLEAGGTGRTMQ